MTKIPMNANRANVGAMGVMAAENNQTRELPNPEG